MNLIIYKTLSPASLNPLKECGHGLAVMNMIVSIFSHIRIVRLPGLKTSTLICALSSVVVISSLHRGLKRTVSG